MKHLVFVLLSLSSWWNLAGQNMSTLSISHQALKQVKTRTVDLNSDNSASVFLEQNAQSFTRETSACKVIKAEGKVYIFDFLSSKIHAYDEAGKYLFTINKKGKGPNEYKHIRKAFIIKPGNLAIWDSMLDKIIVFDSNGVAIKEIKLPYDLDALIYHSDGFYGLGLDNEQYCLIKMDAEGKLIQKWIVAEKEDMAICIKMRSFNCLFIYNDLVCYAIQPMNSIKSLKDGQIKDFLVLDYGKDQIIKNALMANDPLQANREGKTIYIPYIFSRGKFLCFFLADGERSRDLVMVPGQMPLTEIKFRWFFDPDSYIRLLPEFTYADGTLYFLTDALKLEELRSKSTTNSQYFKKITKDIGDRQGLILLKIKDISVSL